jgi:hypothetical protein
MSSAMIANPAIAVATAMTVVGLTTRPFCLAGPRRMRRRDASFY